MRTSMIATTVALNVQHHHNRQHQMNNDRRRRRSTGMNVMSHYEDEKYSNSLQCSAGALLVVGVVQVILLALDPQTWTNAIGILNIVLGGVGSVAVRKPTIITYYVYGVLAVLLSYLVYSGGILATPPLPAACDNEPFRLGLTECSPRGLLISFGITLPILFCLPVAVVGWRYHKHFAPERARQRRIRMRAEWRTRNRPPVGGRGTPALHRVAPVTPNVAVGANNATAQTDVAAADGVSVENEDEYNDYVDYNPRADFSSDDEDDEDSRSFGGEADIEAGRAGVVAIAPPNGTIGSTTTTTTETPPPSATV